MPYVIATPRDSKGARLYRAKTVGGKLMGVVPDSEMWSADAVEIRHSEVILNLGDDPQVGSCYGVWVEPVLRRLTVRGYGEIFMYARLTEATEQRLLRALPEALSRVRAMGPQCDWEMRTEIRNPRGNKWGTYGYKPKGSDVLTIYPVEGNAVRELVKTIAHELGHGVWHRHMSAEERADWIELYDRYIQVTEVSVRDVRTMLRDMRQIGAVRDYMKDAGPEEAAAAAMYQVWLKKVHSIDARELNDLIVAGVEDIPIPNTHLHRSETETPITIYAKRNDAPELFCEAVSSHAVGDLADRSIIKMLNALKAGPPQGDRQRRDSRR